MRKRVTLASFLAFGCALFGLAAANFFPDQTWRALTMTQTLYDRIVSQIYRGQGPSQHAAGFTRKPHPADPNSEITVEQILANPQAYSHRVVKIRGCYMHGFELSEFVSCDATGLGMWPGRLMYISLQQDAPVQQINASCIWLQSSQVAWAQQDRSSSNRPMDEPEPVHLLFHYDAKKDDAACRKLISLNGSQISILAQFETAAGSDRRFGHLGHCSHELILEDVLRPATANSMP